MEHKFKVGDTIRVYQNTPIAEDSNHAGEDNSYFDEYIGRVGKIIALNGKNYDGVPCYVTDIKFIDPDETGIVVLHVNEEKIELQPPLVERVCKILDGIDREEIDVGWWETSTGDSFGAKILELIKIEITHDTEI